MKKFYFTLSLTLLSFFVQAQTDVYLKINHKLDGNPFSHSQVASANVGQVPYRLNRLEYYLGNITLTHDNNQSTPIPNTWILINANTTTNINLGSFNINTLQGISFGIGVESSVNHSDPNQYPGFHPLAPKFPSMHWGWTAGYRFVALEGVTGTNFNQMFQIHALGDVNYRIQNHSISGYMQNGNLIIELDADYNDALNGIAVNGNLLYHGEQNEASTLLHNFQNSVFTSTLVGLEERKELANSLSVYPNPSSGSVQLKTKDAPNLSYKVLDISGREIIKRKNVTSNTNQIEINNSGLYFIQLFQNQELVESKKLVIK